MSDIPLKADIHQRGLHVRLVPEADVERRSQRRLLLIVRIDLDHLHPAQILMVHHMAVEHELAGEIEEARSEGDAAIARDDRCVNPSRLRQRIAVYLCQQHIVYVDLEDVIVAHILVDNRPFLYGAEANTLIHPIGIESLAVNHEPESLPKIRALDVDTRLRECEQAGSGDLLIADELLRQRWKFGGQIHRQRVAFHNEASDWPGRGGIAFIVWGSTKRV